MKAEGQLLPEQGRIPNLRADTPLAPSAHVVFTRDHDVIREWAVKRQAVPATGEATASGPATVDVKDGGAGVRFNFPGPVPIGRFPGTNGSTTSIRMSARSSSTTTSLRPTATATAS
jgi:hypothetical protein